MTIQVALIAHLDEISGAGVALLETARHLNGRNFEVHFVVPGEGPLTQRARAAGLQVHVAPNVQKSFGQTSVVSRLALGVSRAGYVRHLAKLFKRENIDLVYVNTIHGVFAGLAARMSRRRIVWHVHETVEKPSVVMRMKLRFIERNAHGILYASESAQRAFPAKRVTRQMIARNFVDVEALRNLQVSLALRGELGIAEDVEIITTNGLFYRKAPDVFLKAAKIVAEKESKIEFLVVGNAPVLTDSFVAEVRQLAEVAPLSGRVHFVGARDDFRHLLRASTLFVSPSRNEALPIALVECMAMGTPVIATDVGDCAELLDGGRLGLVVPPENPEALANAIIDLLRSEDRGRNRAAMAQEKILHDYALQAFWEPLQEFLNAVACT